ncbi:MAG: hypothetical protein V7642_4722 [Burkholderiales bacterium]
MGFFKFLFSLQPACCRPVEAEEMLSDINNIEYPINAVEEAGAWLEPHQSACVPKRHCAGPASTGVAKHLAVPPIAVAPARKVVAVAGSGAVIALPSVARVIITAVTVAAIVTAPFTFAGFSFTPLAFTPGRVLGGIRIAVWLRRPLLIRRRRGKSGRRRSVDIRRLRIENGRWRRGVIWLRLALDRHRPSTPGIAMRDGRRRANRCSGSRNDGGDGSVLLHGGLLGSCLH